MNEKVALIFQARIPLIWVWHVFKPRRSIPELVSLSLPRGIGGRVRLIFGVMPQDLAPEDFYYSPEGFVVFTEHYHLKRGHCCQSGCKHCPYGFDKRTGRFTKTKETKQ